MKRLLILVGVLFLAWIIINWPYFSKQIGYWFHTRSTETFTNQPSNEAEKGEPNLLRIPSLDINAPIQYVDKVNEEIFQEALQNGIVHYPGTAEIGQLGNPFLFGHSSDFAGAEGNYKTVFALLPKIENGAEILVSNKDGVVYRYQVFDQFVAKKTDLFVLDQRDYKEKLLTLQTSYPVGTALKRYIVVARLKE